MKRLYLALLLIFSLFLSGCYNYGDINRTLFTTAILIDIDEEGNPVVSMEIFHAFRSNKENAEQGQRILYQRNGRTFFDIVDSFEQVAAHPLDYTQNRMIIFTERAAKEGIGDYLDYLSRNQEFLLRPYITIYYGDPVELITAEIRQNEYIGLFLFDLFDRPLARTTIDHYKVYELLRDRRQGKNVAVITAIEIDETPLEDKIRKNGAAVLQNDRLVDKMELEEMQHYSFLMDTVRTGYLGVPHPKEEDKFMTLEIIKSNTITDVVYEEGRLILRKIINLRTTIGGTEGKLILDEETINKITVTTEELLKKNCYELFNKYKNKGLDIFHVQEMVKRRYPRMEIENAIEVIELEIEVNHHLEGSTDVLNFR